MTSARRPTPYRPRRDRREVVVAICAVVAVLVLTGVLLFVLEPDDETPSSPPVQIPTPTTLPGSTVPGSPDETVPATGLPPVTEPAVPNTGG
jgi:hypothetical protein